jgi:hypothetical protein
MQVVCCALWCTATGSPNYTAHRGPPNFHASCRWAHPCRPFAESPGLPQLCSLV